MGKKISLDQLMDDILYITNQKKGLEMLLENKKRLCKEYFKKTGERQLANENLTIYTQERTKIDYDIESIEEKLGPEVSKSFIDKSIEVINSKRLFAMLKQYGVPKSEMKKCLVVTKTVNEAKLKMLYERGDLTVTDLDGCYEATTTNSVALKVKNTDAEITV